MTNECFRVLANCLLLSVVVGGRLAAQEQSAQASQPLAETPFEFSHNLILLTVELGGARPARVVFDTGNSASVLDTAFAKDTGLRPESSPSPAARQANTPAFYKAVIPHVKVGARVFDNQPLVVTGFSKTAADEYGVTADGSLGYGFFRGQIVQIDFIERKFRLLPAPPAAANVSTGIVWRKYQSQSPLLITVDDIVVNGHHVIAQLDTFFGQSLLLFAAKLPWLKAVPISAVPSVRYEEAALSAADAGEVAWGNFIPRSRGEVYVAGADAHVPETEINAVAGNSFFQGALLTIDLRSVGRGGQIYITKQKEPR